MISEYKDYKTDNNLLESLKPTLVLDVILRTAVYFKINTYAFLLYNKLYRFTTLIKRGKVTSNILIYCYMGNAVQFFPRCATFVELKTSSNYFLS